jgi:glycosyltransferase involved in cell wall biosynthesis
MSLSPADGFIVHAQADADKLQREFPEKKILVATIPTFAGLGGDSTQPVHNLPKERPLLLFFGFVRPYKGLDILIDALALVRQEFEAHLIVAGEFWDDELKYINQIKNLGLESNVSIVNRYLPDEELVAYVDSADVVVLPYRSATQSAIVQVAFGRGKAVITTNVGGLAEVVEDGLTGFVVPPEDPEALAKAILRFFEEDLKSNFQQNIIEQMERFTWDRLIGIINGFISDD